MSWFSNLGNGLNNLFTKGDPSTLGDAVLSGVKTAAKVISDPAFQSIGMALAPELAPEIALAGGVANGINNSNII